jgi:hypothetical protein
MHMQDNLPDGFIKEVIERHNIVLITYNANHDFNDEQSNYFLTGKAVRKFIIGKFGTNFRMLVNKRSEGFIAIEKDFYSS